MFNEADDLHESADTDLSKLGCTRADLAEPKDFVPMCFRGLCSEEVKREMAHVAKTTPPELVHRQAARTGPPNRTVSAETSGIRVVRRADLS